MSAVGVGVFIVAIATMLVVSLFLLGCRKYEEGVSGNLGLGILALGCAIVLVDFIKDRLELPSPLYLLIILASALVLARHAYRFAMFHWHGYFGWSPPADMKRAPAGDIQ